MLRQDGWQTKAKCIEAMLALHIRSTMPEKSNLFPNLAA